MLGAAPGVGKTFAMLEEGHRLRGLDHDVVVGFIETHDRPATAALVSGLEVIPRTTVDYHGVRLDEMDVDAIVARKPETVLVDELAHTNAPGSVHEKRWQDVNTLLAAGIDVVSTVNIQHIESLNDVVRGITGVTQRETIPDAVLRSADQIELVDLAPQALRDRLGKGLVYPAARIDAALSNYFRMGNLTALRELALLWLADEVDSALQAYRVEHEITEPWQARERIVVALAGGREGDTLLRRGARIAARHRGGQLYAVHVTRADGLAAVDSATVAKQRALTETLGGTFHQVVSDDIPLALVEFARSVSATQIVIGVSRRSRFAAMIGGASIGQSVIRLAGDIDVYIVSHADAGRGRLPRAEGALSSSRRLWGFVFALAAIPLVTWPLATLRSESSIASDVLAYQLLIVVVALIGGIWPALFSALVSGLALDFFFIDPVHRVSIADPLYLVALLLSLVVASLVSLVVDQAARRSRAATRSAAEAEMLVTVAGSVISGADAVEALVSRLREAFGMAKVSLMQGGSVVYAATDSTVADSAYEATTVPLGDIATLVLSGRPLPSSDRKILGAFVAQLEAALRQRELTAEAEGMRPVAAADKLRSALLAALGHELRRPLAAAMTAVTSLRATDVTLPDDDRTELLVAAHESLESLSGLVTDLLDASRLQAGVLGVSLAPVALDEVVTGVLDELGLSPGEVELNLSTVRPVSADFTLLQRVVVNLLANALRYSPEGCAPVISTSELGDRVQLRVVDTGHGVPRERREEIFLPFQRLGDTDNTAGIGLGLALSKGFVEGMGGTLDPEDTPGGGLTMVVELPAAGANLGRA